MSYSTTAGSSSGVQVSDNVSPPAADGPGPESREFRGLGSTV